MPERLKFISHDGIYKSDESFKCILWKRSFRLEALHKFGE